MGDSERITLLLLVIALILFFFSLSLLPAVEFYCRFKRPAIVLLILEFVLLLFCASARRNGSSHALTIATFVFGILGLAFNAVLLLAVKGKC